MATKQTNKERIAVTGLGMVSSAGLTALSSVAAVLARMQNFRVYKKVLLLEQDGKSLRGATIARVSDDFINPSLAGAERARAMLLPAIREAVYGVQPEMLKKAFCRIESAADQNIMRLLAAKLPYLPPCTGDSPKGIGRCLAIENVIQAVEDLLQGKHQMALVAVADSLVDDDTLSALAKANRLLSATNPEGIIAGELAGAVLLETESHARKRNARIYAYITGWGKGEEPNPWTGPKPSRAEGLTNAFLDALEKCGQKENQIEMIINDLNGERARALEWGLTQSRVFSSGNQKLMHPADRLGDCGAASAMALLVLAAGVMLMKWMPPHYIAVSASDDEGSRRSLILEKGDSLDRAQVIDFHKEQYKIENSAELPSIEKIRTCCVDDAAFLIVQRERIRRAADYSFADLSAFDDRLDAAIECLKMAGSKSRDTCLENHYLGNSGLFPLAVVAFTSGIPEWIDETLTKAEKSPDCARPVISALCWIGKEAALPHIQALFASENPVHQRIALSASAIMRMDIGQNLMKALSSNDPLLRARALRMAGELGRKDCLRQLQGALKDSDEGCRFWSAWSLALLGDKNSSSAALTEFAEKNGLYSETAADMAARILNPASVLALHKRLADSEKTVRPAVKVARAFGDPALMPWIIEQMGKPQPARLAGDAFSTITGVNISDSSLEGDEPDGFHAGPTDDPDDPKVKMDPDEFLPWPDQGRIKSWWEGQKNSFKSGVRCFMGQPINEAALKQVLTAGNQAVRHAAAIEKSLLTLGRPLFNAGSPVWRQMEEIENS